MFGFEHLGFEFDHIRAPLKMEIPVMYVPCLELLVFKELVPDLLSEQTRGGTNKLRIRRG